MLIVIRFGYKGMHNTFGLEDRYLELDEDDSSGFRMAHERRTFSDVAEDFKVKREIIKKSVDDIIKSLPDIMKDFLSMSPQGFMEMAVDHLEDFTYHVDFYHVPVSRSGEPINESLADVFGDLPPPPEGKQWKRDFEFSDVGG